MQPHPPPVPGQYPRRPGMSPVPPGRFYDPPTEPLPRPHPFPKGTQRGPLPYPHHQRPAGGGFWAPVAPAARGRRRPLYLGAAIMVGAVAMLISGFWAPGFFVTTQLDVTAVQSGVTQVLSDPAGYGAKNVSDVTCNDGQNPTVTKGGTFTCQATIDHLKHQFLVTFTDDTGSYEVSAPKGTKV